MSAPEPGPPVAPSRRRLVLQTVGAFAAATVLAALVVLPAEYGIDPTGFGAATGLTRLRGPVEVGVPVRAEAPPEIARVADAPFLSETVEIEVGPAGGFLPALEYKITMQAGQALIYSWSAPADLYFEFHGHTNPDPASGEIRVMTYMTGTAAASHGTLIAPIDGIHGWFFRNDGSEPVTLELRLTGYYTLAPGLLF